MAPSEAEPIKRALSLARAGRDSGGLHAGAGGGRARAVGAELQTFARELVSSLQFYQNQPGSLGIGEIVLTGGTAQLPGLAAELERLIGVHVRVGDPFARVKVSRSSTRRDQIGSLAIAIGLGIEDSMRAVNLLPREEQPRSFAAMRGVAFGGAGGVALVTVALTALMIGAGGSIQQQNAERDALNAQLAALPHAAVDQQESDTNAALASEKNLRVTALSSALSTRVAWDRVLSQISQVLPEDVWLTSLTSAAGETADASTTTGAVGLPARASRWSARRIPSAGSPGSCSLGVIPALSGVHLLSSSNVDLKPRDLVEFTIQATVKAPGATP